MSSVSIWVIIHFNRYCIEMFVSWSFSFSNFFFLLFCFVLHCFFYTHCHCVLHFVVCGTCSYSTRFRIHHTYCIYRLCETHYMTRCNTTIDSYAFNTAIEQFAHVIYLKPYYFGSTRGEIIWEIAWHWPFNDFKIDM